MTIRSSIERQPASMKDMKMSKPNEPNPMRDAAATRKVQELLECGQSLGIAIDSNYYITKGGGTLDVPFRSKLANWKGRFQHLIPTIWELEIKRHLRARISTAREKALNISEKDISILQSSDAISALKSLRSSAEAVDSTQTAETLWNSFAVETHATTVNPPLDSATTVLNWYFEQRLPFEGAGNKKHEFPDAFALHSLNTFAEDHNLQVVVVATKDSGAYGHCATTERLLPFHDVQSAIGAFDARDLIERRRQLSVEASDSINGKRLATLIERLIRCINRPYQHSQQAWPAITKPSFPQNPRIVIDQLLEYELLPFGNFDLPISVSSITNGLDGTSNGVGAGVVLRAKIRLKALASCEISAIDTQNNGQQNPRQRFALDNPVEKEVSVEFSAKLPITDDDPISPSMAIGQFGSYDPGILSIEADAVSVVVPDRFEYRGFA